MKSLFKAIEIAGGQANLGRMVNKNARSSFVHNWIKRGKVPAEWCPSIERATGVRCEELRPDVEWHVLRSSW